MVGYLGKRGAWAARDPFGERRRVVGWALLCGVAVACSSPPTLQSTGGTCFQVSDCKAGLVCVPQSDGSHVCSTDTSSLVMTETDGSSATTPPPANSTGTAGMDAGASQAPEAAPAVDEGGDDASE